MPATSFGVRPQHTWENCRQFERRHSPRVCSGGRLGPNYYPGLAFCYFPYHRRHYAWLATVMQFTPRPREKQRELSKAKRVYSRFAKKGGEIKLFLIKAKFSCLRVREALGKLKVCYRSVYGRGVDPVLVGRGHMVCKGSCWRGVPKSLRSLLNKLKCMSARHPTSMFYCDLACI